MALAAGNLNIIEKMMIRILLFFLAAIGTGHADTQVNELAAEYKAEMAKIESVQRLPVSGLSMVKAGDKTFLITDNGHFVIAGNYRLVDLWQGKILAGIDDLKGVDKVDLQAIGISADELGAFTIGRGAKEVVTFVDPKCEHCNDMLRQMPALGDDYRFKIVLIPVLGHDSAELSKKLLCEKDKKKALQYLMEKEYSKLQPVDKSCSLDPLKKAVISTKMLDITGVPYTFLPNKLTHKGSPKDLKALLETNYAEKI